MRRIAEANTDKFAIYAGNRFLIIRHLFEQHLVESLGKGESDLI